MILIADDDTDFAENCSMLLESYGYDTSVVLNGTDALASISDQLPELLISDCGMPRISGPELSGQLRAGPSTRGLPILLMSGSLRCQVAPGSSYDAFLRKPFLAEELLFEVRRLLQDSTVTSHQHQGHQ